MAIRGRAIRRNFQKGAILPLIGAIGVALAILLLHIAQTVKFNSGQMVYFNHMNHAYRVAESAMTIALGQLSATPSTGTLPTIVSLDGYYENHVQRISTPVVNGFYIHTIASVTAPSGRYSCAMHTYASIANISDYFAAVKNELILSTGIDARNGKVYAPNVTFWADPSAPPTRIQQADYVYAAVVQHPTLGQLDIPSDWPLIPIGASSLGMFVIPNAVCLGDNQDPLGPNYCRDNLGATVLPKQMTAPLQFPSLTGADFQRYRQLADTHILLGAGNWLDFTGMTFIFPPGYVTSSGNPHSSDEYDNSILSPLPGRENQITPNANVRHVFYAEHGIKLGRITGGTTIYGQVLFVTPGDIEIYGDIYSTMDSYLPGQGIYQSSSTAHQAVLLAGGDIIIKTNGVGLSAGTTRRIEAFLYCPNGNLFVEDTTGAEALLRNFRFVGSFILGDFALPRNNLPTQFTGSRSYSYMTTLKTNPPPYLPALSEIFYRLEEVTESPGLNF